MNKKIAIIAGALDLPILTKKALIKEGWEVFVIGIKNYFDKKLNPDLIVRLGAGGVIARELKKRDITNLTFVGALGHINLYNIIPDFWSIKILLSVLKNQKGYDSMAVSFTKELEKRGYNILPAQDLSKELSFDKKGVPTKTKPQKKDEWDINRAIEVSKIIGKEDIGTSVVVDKQVLAVEASEGTSNMLKRVINMKKKKKSGVFAKILKPNQDLRIDIPAIGIDTVKAVAQANLRGIIINAKSCFVINKEKVVNEANKNKIFIKII